MENELERVQKQWNEQAEKWNKWVGDHGDANRIESSDVYLWKYIENIDDQVIVDAGCETNYWC